MKNVNTNEILNYSTWRLKPALAIIVTISLYSQPTNAEVIYLGDLDGGAFNSLGFGVSADGSTVVGQSNSNGNQAFRWSLADGMIGLGDLPGGAYYSSARAVSADGLTIAGESSSVNGFEAFRWTEADGMIGLGDLAGGSFESKARAISADGSIITGTSNSANGIEAFRWTQGEGMVGLGDLNGGDFESYGLGISGDGLTIVGISSSTDGFQAYRWTEIDGMVGLGDLAGGIFSSTAYGASSDGSVIVGFGTSDNGIEAFRWTEANGMTGLGDLVGGAFLSYASAVSANGTTVVGVSNSDNGDEAFRWTEASGMQTLNDWLSETGVNTTGIIFDVANAVSEDGSVVVGYGNFGNGGNEAYLAKSGSGLINVDDFAESFDSVAAIPQTSLFLPNTIMQGAHHRILMEQTFADQNKMIWATGDLAADNDRDADISIGEVGIAHDFARGYRAGFGVGHGRLNQDLFLNGKNDLAGQYVVAELDYIVPDTSVIFSLTALYGDWASDIRRGYLNGIIPDSSFGTTDSETLSLRLRADWLDAFQIGGFSFSPRISYTHTEADTDGYTETGGGFPASFKGMSYSADEARIGLTASKQLNTQTTVRWIMEGIHRFDDNTGNLNGEVTGLFPFSIASPDNNQTWARIGGECSHMLQENIMITGSAFVATRGEDPEITTSINLRYSF